MNNPFATRSRSRPDLVVIVNGFPRLSETFVLQELLDLEGRGVRLHVFAMRHPEEIVAQEALAELQATVEYLDDPRAARTIAVRAAHGALAILRRASYFHGLAEVVSSRDFSRSRLKVSVLLAHRIVRLGAPPVYIHFAHKPATVGRFAALLAGVPYAMSAHAKDVWLTPVKELRAKIRDAEAVLVCTRESYEYASDLAGYHTPVHLIYHGVDVPAAALPPAALPPAANETPVILGVGRLVEKKGYDVLLRAAALLRDRGVAFQLRLGGEGPAWGGLQRLVNELRMEDSVTFLGPLETGEVQSEYARADVFALACRQLADGDRDGLPNVVVEAMVRGLPVVSTTSGGVSEAIVDGESGILVDPDDHVALAAALERVLGDAELRHRLGMAARESAVARFDRVANLPAVSAALAAAGIIRPEAADR